MKLRHAVCIIAALAILAFPGCAGKNSQKNAADEKPQLIFEQEASPNRKFVEKVDDTLYYGVQVYQKKDHSLIIKAKSCLTSDAKKDNEKEFTLACSKEITKLDVDVQWTTTSGKLSSTENDRIAIADVKIQPESKLIAEKKIDFTKEFPESKATTTTVDDK